MEGLVNYSSEEEREESPKRNAAERCPAHEIDPNKRSKGASSRRPREQNIRSSTNDGGQSLSYRDNETSHGSFRKVNSHKEESNRGSGRFTGNRDYYHRADRRPDRNYDKKRDSKDERKRRDCHRERDHDHEYRDVDRDRRERSDRYRRDRHDKDNSYRDKHRRRRSSESTPPTSKDRNTNNSNYRNRNRSSSRSPSKEYPSHNKTNSSVPTAENIFRGGKQQKFDQKEETTPTPTHPLPQSKMSPNLQAVISLPLNDAPPKMPNPNNRTEGTAIALPTYYNPNIINPTKYAEQVQKRKLIWGAKKAEDTAAKWGHATFSEDSDGKVASKFMRLMGIKSTPKPVDKVADISSGEKTGPDVKSRQAMFSNMEQQYEVARQVTHTMRGVGLGFGSQSRQY